MRTMVRNTFFLLLAALLCVVLIPHDASSAYTPMPSGTGIYHVVSGHPAATASPVDLASSVEVFHVLPAANQAPQSLSGDATGTTTAVAVNASSGLKNATTTVSTGTAGAPTIGQVLTALTSTTASWQTASAVPHNLPRASKSANYTIVSTDYLIVCVTNTGFAISLPASPSDGDTYAIANLAAGTNTVNGGLRNIGPSTTYSLAQYGAIIVTWDAAETAWIVDNGITAAGGSSAGGSGQVQTSDGAGGFTAPTNFNAGANFISLGGVNPSLTGTIRLANNTDIRVRDVANGNDRVLMSFDSSNQMWIGTDAGFTTAQPGAFRIAAGSIIIGTGTTQDFALTGSTAEFAVPVIGHTGNSSPYGVHGGVVVTPAVDNNVTLTTAQYALDWIEVDTGVWLTGPFGVVLPTPAAKAKGFYKTVYNASTKTITLQNGGVAARTLATLLAQRIWVDDGGVFYAGPTFTP